MSRVRQGGAASVAPPEIQVNGLPSEAALAALNGHSAGSTRLWDASPGDYLRGEVTGVEEYQARWGRGPETKLELLVGEGSECGEALPVGVHRAILGRHVELRRMVSAAG